MRFFEEKLVDLVDVRQIGFLLVGQQVRKDGLHSVNICFFY